uniref:NTF2 domain-containing protein n=1 Tax=Panagrolaimus sp. JU765 TaxID=591449 RepID=A0AC34RIV2_9BILA
MGDRNRSHYRPRYTGPPKPEDPAVTAGKQLSNLYFGAIDDRREKLSYLYAGNCRLLINGNPYVGFEQINDFWTKKMPATEHNRQSICCTLASVINMLTIVTSGSVEFEEKQYCFTSTLTCIHEEGMWKIFTDNYRFFEYNT